jgi:nitrous oxidase accessory protein NosD
MKYIVSDNTIRTRGDSSMGIAVLANDAVVTNNAIVAEGKASRPLVLFGSNATVIGNRIEGTGDAAVHFSARAKPMTGSRNLLIGNAISSFRPARGTVIQEDDGVQANLVLDAAR